MFPALAQVYPVFPLQLQYRKIFCLRKNVDKTKVKRSVHVLNNTNTRLLSSNRDKNSALDGGDLSTTQPDRSSLGQSDAVRIPQEAGWASQPVWTLRTISLLRRKCNPETYVVQSTAWSLHRQSYSGDLQNSGQAS